MGTAFALEKAVLLRLPDARTAAHAWDLAIAKDIAKPTYSVPMLILYAATQVKQADPAVILVDVLSEATSPRFVLRSESDPMSALAGWRGAHDLQSGFWPLQICYRPKEMEARCLLWHMTQRGRSPGFGSHCGREEGGDSRSKDAKACQEQPVKGCERCRSLACT